jgi:hypothetical protein
MSACSGCAYEAACVWIESGEATTKCNGPHAKINRHQFDKWWSCCSCSAGHLRRELAVACYWKHPILLKLSSKPKGGWVEEVE